MKCVKLRTVFWNAPEPTQQQYHFHSDAGFECSRSEVTGIHWCCHLRFTDASGSLNYLIILWTVMWWNVLIPWNVILINILGLFAVLPKWWTSLYPSLWTTEGRLLWYQIMKVTCFHLTRLPVECYKQVFLEHPSTFPVFYCPLSHVFLSHDKIAGSTQAEQLIDNS